ncbi:MAG: hypothetical protein PVG49_14220 [Desulfobacteraceae bacterium]
MTRNPLISSILFVIYMYLSFGVPILYAQLSVYRERKVFIYLAILIIHCIISYIMLRFAVPMESIGDIVGAPILSWPWELETIVRFIPLYFVVIFSITFAAVICLVIYMGARTTVLMERMLFGAIFLPLSHWVVVRKAATDNLVELMDGGGTVLTSLLIWLCILALALTASQIALLATRIRRKVLGFSLASFLCSFPGAFLCLHYATEHHIVKYGKEFSALQFLLSTDRENYAQLPELLIRYAMAHIGLVFLIAFVQVPFWVWIVHRKSEGAIQGRPAFGKSSRF